jgi:hypothetical protein
MDFVFFLFAPFAHGTNLGFLLYLSFYKFFFLATFVGCPCLHRVNLLIISAVRRFQWVVDSPYTHVHTIINLKGTANFVKKQICRNKKSNEMRKNIPAGCHFANRVFQYTTTQAIISGKAFFVDGKHFLVGKMPRYI